MQQYFAAMQAQNEAFQRQIQAQIQAQQQAWVYLFYLWYKENRWYLFVDNYYKYMRGAYLVNAINWKLA